MSWGDSIQGQVRGADHATLLGGLELVVVDGQRLLVADRELDALGQGRDVGREVAVVDEAVQAVGALDVSGGDRHLGGQEGQTGAQRVENLPTDEVGDGLAEVGSGSGQGSHGIGSPTVVRVDGQSEVSGSGGGSLIAPRPNC